MSAPPRGAHGLPDIIATAFALLVKHRGRFLLLALPGAVLSTAATFLLEYVIDTGAGNKPADNGQLHLGLAFYAALIGSSMVIVLAAFLSDALVVPAAFDALLGRRPDVRGALTLLPRIAPALIVGWLVIGSSLLLMLLSVVAIPVAAFLAVRWSFFIQELCREPSGATLAIRRSVGVVQGFWWRAFAVHVAILLLGTLPNLVIQPVERNVHFEVLNVALAFAAVWLAAPFSAVGRTLLYSDIKLRKGDRVQDRATLGG